MRSLSLLVLAVVIAGCGGHGGGGSTQPAAPAPVLHSISGTVTGLSGTGLVLANGADRLSVIAGTFTFATSVATGSSFNVTVATQPSGPTQMCVVANGSGTVSGSDVTNVAVTCTTTEVHSISGTVTGLSGAGLVLANGGENLNVAAGASTFAFANSVASGSAFNVTVATQPTSPSQTCTVAHGSGTVSGTDVTNVAVSCATNSFTVGGSVTGLAASGLTLTLAGFTQNVAVPAAGPYAFTFPNALASGTQYAVSVATDPTNPVQACSVAHASGTIGSASITNVAVSCNAALEQLLVLGGATITSYFIDPSTGAPGLSSATPLGLASNLVGRIVTDATRHFVYTAISGTNAVGQYHIDASTGTPISSASTPVGSDVFDVVTTGNFAFALSGGDAWTVNLTTKTTSQALIPTSGWGGMPTGAAGFIDTSSAFVYYHENFLGCGCYSLGGFAINGATGALTSIAPNGLFSNNSPTSLGVIEPQGKYLLFAALQQVGGVMQALIGTYAIDPGTGALTQQSSVAQPSTDALTGLVVHPNGKFVYVTDGASVWGYSLSSGGVLTTNGSGLTVNGATDFSGRGTLRPAMGFNPSAQYLYVANRSEKTIAAIVVDANTGGMTLVPGTPFVLAGDVRGVISSRIP
jgi:hypothetical protein